MFRASRPAEAGETLVEVLVTIAILGLAAVAILGGVQLAVKTSIVGRNQSSSQAYVRSLAEAIQNNVAVNGYTTCGGTSDYITANTKKQAGLPSTYTASITVTKAWTSSGWKTCTAALDTGLQQLTLSVVSPGGAGNIHQVTEVLNVVVRKPCSGSLPNPC